MEIQDIKTQLSLATVLQHYGLQPNSQKMLHCPFHADKTPSLQVYYNTQTCYCFSANCKTHGKPIDVIDFIMHKENSSKHQAIEKCKELINGTTVQQGTTEKLTKTAVLTKLFIYFKNAMYNSAPAKDYAHKQRNLDSKQITIGYNSGQFHHRENKHLITSALQYGLLQIRPAGGYSVWGKYCLIFPLYNKNNQIISLYGRSTINHKEQKHYYLKNREGLYPKYPDVTTKKLILTESIIDAASLLQIPAITDPYSVLALYGTNGLTEEHQQAIQAIENLSEIIFAFDNDEAGHKAAAKYSQELQQILPQIIYSKIHLPCKDVNETLVAHNEQIFIHLLQERTTDFSFSIETGSAGSQTPSEKNKNSEQKKETLTKHIEKAVLQTIVPSSPLTNHPARLDTTNPYKLRYTTDTAHYYIQGGLPKTTDHLKIMLVIEHKTTNLKARNKIDLYEDKQVEKLCTEVAEKLQIRKDILAADIYTLTDLLEQHIEAVLQTNKEAASQQAPKVLTIKERTELEVFAQKPKLIKQVNNMLGQSGIIGEERNRIFLFLIALSHKMPDPLHALIQGSSGSGKTRLLKQISDCIPKENVTKLTRLSDKVLYNFPENYFVNRLLCLEDIDGLSEEAEFAFRELQSNGELNSATSIKLENGQITSGQKKVRGPIASLACTTRGEIYEDNMSRVFLIAVDESKEQTQRIIDYQNQVAAGLIDKKEQRAVAAFLQNFISILQPYEVINPYASQIHLPPAAHKIRRLNDLFQNCIKMVTILHQYQRKKDERKRLITAIEDIETAVAVMFESIVLKVDELDGSLRQFYEQLKNYLQQQYNGSHQTTAFSLREVRQALKLSKTQLFRYANDLTHLEYIQQCGGYQNKGYTYTISYWDNYQNIREKIKSNLDQQIKELKSGTLRNAIGTLQPV